MMQLNEDDLKRLALGEMDVLRKELHDLKECQFRFLSTTPMATGLLLGLPQIFVKLTPDTKEPHSPLFLTSLLALLVLLPAWWVFFDKAKTVTRIVGYYRILEAMVRGEFQPERFLGWERSLEIFRRARPESSLATVVARAKVETFLTDDERRRLDFLKLSRWRRTIKSLPRFIQATLLTESQRYWLIAYDTFAVLSFVSLIFPAAMLIANPGHLAEHWGQWVVLATASILVIWCSVENAMVLTDLMWGHYSYTANHMLWIHIMASRGDAPDEGPAEKYAFARRLIPPVGGGKADAASE